MKNLCEAVDVLASWKRCINNGLNPDIKIFQKTSENLEYLLKEHTNIIHVFNKFIDQIDNYILEEHYFLLCNNQGIVFAQNNNKKKLMFQKIL